MLQAKVVEFVARGDFGLASGRNADGTFGRVWFAEPVAPDEVAFEPGVFLLRKPTAEALKRGTPAPHPGPLPPPDPGPGPEPPPVADRRTLRVSGQVPPELWNRLGTKVLPKLRAGGDPRISVDVSATVTADKAKALETELRQALADLGLEHALRIEWTGKE